MICRETCVLFSILLGCTGCLTGVTGYAIPNLPGVGNPGAKEMGPRHSVNGEVDSGPRPSATRKFAREVPVPVSALSDATRSRASPSNRRDGYGRPRKRDIFMDFYEAKGRRSAPFVQDTFIDDKHDKLEPKSDPDMFAHTNLMDHLISILLTGRLGKTKETSSLSSLVTSHNYLSQLSSVSRQGTFLEIGTGVTSLFMAKENTPSIITALIMPDTAAEAFTDLSAVHNVFVGTVAPAGIAPLLKSLQEDPEVFFGSILVSNLTALIGNNLPHEYERLIGTIILLAKETFLAPPAQGDEASSSYMKSWNSLSHLAERACFALQLSCALSSAPSDTWDSPTLTKVTLLEGQRPVAPRFCCSQPREDCVLTYRQVNGSDVISMDAGYRPGFRFQRTGLLLSTLLQLNPVGASLEKLLEPLLDIETDQERIAKNVLVTGKGFIIHSEVGIPCLLDILSQWTFLHTLRDKNLGLRSGLIIPLFGSVPDMAGCLGSKHKKMKLQQGGHIAEILYGKEDNAIVPEEKSSWKDPSRDSRRQAEEEERKRTQVESKAVLMSQRISDSYFVRAKYSEKTNSLNSHRVDRGKNVNSKSIDINNLKTSDGNKPGQLVNRNFGSSSAINKLSGKMSVNGKDRTMSDVGLRREKNFGAQQQQLQRGESHDVGLQGMSALADSSAGVHQMQRGDQQSVNGWNKVNFVQPEEARGVASSRRLEWEKAREGYESSRGAGQSMMKSQVDMVADLWHRETGGLPDIDRNSDRPGKHWDREEEEPSQHPQSAKLVAVGNLLRPRDEDNPAMMEEAGRGGYAPGDQTRRDDVGEKPGGGSNIGGDGKLPDSGKRVYRKQRRKQFRKAVNDEGNELDQGRIPPNREPLTPAGSVTKAGHATERELGSNKQQKTGHWQYGDVRDEGVGGGMDANAGLPDEQELLRRRREMINEAVQLEAESRRIVDWQQLDTSKDDVVDGEEELMEEEQEEEVEEGGDVYGYEDDVGLRDDGMEVMNMDNDYHGNSNDVKRTDSYRGDTEAEPDFERREGRGEWGEELGSDGRFGGEVPGRQEERWRNVERVSEVMMEEPEEEDEEEEIGRMMKMMLKEKETEGEEIFDDIWRQLEGSLRSEGGSVFSLMSYGGKDQSLLSAKVSRTFPNASILTIIPPSAVGVATSHRKLRETLQLTNNILVQTSLTDKVVRSLYQQMEYFRFQVLGLATFRKLNTYGSAFPAFLGQLLALSQTTFIEVPHPASLLAASILLKEGQSNGNPDKSFLYQGFLSSALEQAGVLDYEIRVLSGNYLANHAKLVRIDIKAFSRQVSMDCSGSQAWFKQDASKPVSLAPLRSAAAGDFPLQKVGVAVRLQSLLTLGLRPIERKLLFIDYLKLPIHDDMCPMSILWEVGRIVYSPIMEDSEETADLHTPCADDRRALFHTAMEQLDRRPFSFLEYGSAQDGLMFSLAAKHPNSTFVGVTGSEREVERQHKVLAQRGINNTIIASIPADLAFARNLASSPDFLRYQYMGLGNFLSFITSNKREIVQTTLGNIISTGVTTFLQLPSSQMLSLAITTFYPDAVRGRLTEGKDLYLADKHPLPPFKNAELRLVKENIKLTAGQVNVSARVVHPKANADGSNFGWSLVRVDVRHLNLMVDHHFMYVLDGHSRKYQLHCRSNTTDFEVFLVRAKDGFKIPYEEVKGISLIALLRMGLLPAIKEAFYSQFLQLPLYGDMAPWNIVFSGGSLEYIDYDSKQLTFDKVAPAAYQIMAMLMNYRRTVNDFGHCQFDGRNPYNIELISHCVGSDFNGPCTDERYPVACADRTCRSTFIDCLRALGDLEQKHSGVKASEEPTGLVQDATRGRGEDGAPVKKEERELEGMDLSFQGESRGDRMTFLYQ
ncbi:uncharacterized protein [Diadema antillarum]|uniref:uncharacterized protein n=1 Tax=Diadema antillarum TaxID=105358 RepID=UPI003A86C0B7